MIAIFNGQNVYHDINVHVVDPELYTCEALMILLRVEGFMTTFSVHADAFAASFHRYPPNILLLNRSATTKDGSDLLKRTVRERPNTAVILIQDVPDLDDSAAALQIGAFDVLAKPLDSILLVELVKAATAHVRALGGIAPRNGPRLGVLTGREYEVLESLLAGHSNKEAGRDLGISPRTIEVHRARIMHKLGAKNVVDLVHKAKDL